MSDGPAPLASGVDVVLGIDVGTSGVRIAAVDGTLRLRAMASSSIPAPGGRPGRPSLPIAGGGHTGRSPLTWWQATREALEQLDLTGLRVRALAVDGTSGTILPVDGNGAPGGDGSMYHDVADPSVLARVDAVAPRETAALGSSSPLARAIELQGRGVRIVHQADWIAAQFSRRCDVTDENNALKTGYDPLARSWPAWIDAAGLDRRRLPTVVPAGTPVGPIDAGVAAALGLPADVLIVAGTTDGCAAFLASGAASDGDGVTSLGTTLTVKLLSARPVFAPDLGVYSHRIGEWWLAGGASNAGGGVVAAYFDADDLARLSPALRPEEPTGLDYYPLTAPGERFPTADPALQPRLAPRPDEDAVFLQGILEGIAAIEVRGYRALAELGASPLTSIRTTGGGAANEAWTRIRVRMLGVPTRPVTSEHAAVGAARLAWWGVGHAC